MRKTTKILSSMIVAAVLITSIGTVEAAVRGGDRLRGNHYQDNDVTLYAGTTYRIELDGDGSTDLDMFVFDALGNRVASDVSSSDDAVIFLRVYKTGTFKIRVKNLGRRSNLYRIKITP